MKEAHIHAHTEPLREIMHLLIMGVVRGDREQLVNACEQERSLECMRTKQRHTSLKYVYQRAAVSSTYKRTYQSIFWASELGEEGRGRS